jgi:hypothetical protein
LLLHVRIRRGGGWLSGRDGYMLRLRLKEKSFANYGNLSRLIFLLLLLHHRQANHKIISET